MSFHVLKPFFTSRCIYILPVSIYLDFRHWKMTLKLKILRSLTRLFIIVVSSLFSEKCLFPINALLVWCPTWSKSLGRSLLQMLWKLGIHTTMEAETRKCYFNSITNSCYSLWPSPVLSLWEQFSTVCLCDSSRHSLYFLTFPVGF